MLKSQNENCVPVRNAAAIFLACIFPDFRKLVVPNQLDHMLMLFASVAACYFACIFSGFRKLVVVKLDLHVLMLFASSVQKARPTNAVASSE